MIITRKNAIETGFKDPFKKLKSIATESAFSLEVYEQEVLVDPTSAACVVTLPNVTEAKGLKFTFELTGSANAVTVADLDNDAAFTTKTVSATSRLLVLESNGDKWYIVNE